MNYRRFAKLILFLFPLLLFLSVVFSSGRFLCLNLRMLCQERDSFTANALPESYPHDGATRAEIIEDMQRIGAVKKGFAEWYVSLQGTSTGSGSADSPLDLTTALLGGTPRARIKPGDVVWIRGGTYAGSFTARAIGTVDGPIHFRSFPGERVVLEKTEASREVGTLDVKGSHLWFWDLEITNSFPDRRRLDPNGELNPWRGSGINVWAANTKYINLTIHNNGHGFGLWNQEGGTEIYGCLIFNNGNNKKEHGIYGHNKTGTQRIADNIIFNNAGYGLHLYANSTKSYLNGFEIEGNTIFNNGALTGVDQVADQILVGGVQGVPATRITLRENYVYTEPDSPTSKNRGIRLGYEDENNHDVKILNNYVVGKVPLKILWWNAVEAHGNTIITSDRNIEIETIGNADLAGYRFSSNRYRSTEKNIGSFLVNGSRLSFDQWKDLYDFDDSGEWMYTNGMADKFDSFVRRNKYNPRRATVIVYGTGRSRSALVNLNDFLQKGDTFEVRDAQNYFDPPLIRTVFDGRDVHLPLDGKGSMPPKGQTERLPVHTGTGFAVFVIFRIANG